MKKVLITGVAGFIGYHLSKKLCQNGLHVFGIDNINDYYDISLKKARLSNLENPNFVFEKCDLNSPSLRKIITQYAPDVIVNLAAQVGVRNSLTNPMAYVESNISGFVNLLEIAKDLGLKHLIYASSSSVYGKNKKVPSSVADKVDEPISLYAATKRSNELIAHAYSHLYSIPITGLRFFTVYGSWGRPDMAYFVFTKKILNNDPIAVFNKGDHRRDFTHISDVTESIFRLLEKPPTANRIFNIGAGQPVQLLEFINILSDRLGRKPKLDFLPMQSGDVFETHADVRDLEEVISYRPKVLLAEGLNEFVSWYQSYYK